MDDPQCRYDPKGCQSLLGYGRAAHARSGGICVYCDLGKERIDFGVWRQLSVDHVVPARLFPGGGRTLQSVFPNLPKSELRKLVERVNGINLVTACNFCNSMTSRMNDISADGILSSEGYGDVTSVDAEPPIGDPGASCSATFIFGGSVLIFISQIPPRLFVPVMIYPPSLVCRTKLAA